MNAHGPLGDEVPRSKRPSSKETKSLTAMNLLLLCLLCRLHLLLLSSGKLLILE